MTEDEVIRRCQAGDRDAFRAVVDQYKDVLYGTAYLMTNSRTAAEDQVQEAFISAWKGIGGFRTGRPIKPWLVRILVNKVLSYRRANSNAMPSIDMDFSESHGGRSCRGSGEARPIRASPTPAFPGTAPGGPAAVFHRAFSGRDIGRSGAPAGYGKVSGTQSVGAVAGPARSGQRAMMGV